MSYDAAKLKRLFRHYNQRYWNGELPDYRIRFGRLPGHGLIKQYPEMAAKHELTLEGMGHCDICPASAGNGGSVRPLR